MAAIRAAWSGVYCGSSAGAAVAASAAPVGGCRVGELEVCDADFGEELDQVDVRPGDLQVHGLGGAYRVGRGTIHVLAAS